VTSTDKDGDDTSSRYLIFDDTVLPKTGKSIEKIGKVWDHVTNRYVLGFKLLVMMYTGTANPPYRWISVFTGKRGRSRNARSG
jgi:hypothetical protein